MPRRLCDLSFLAKLGVTGCVFTLALGLYASWLQVQEHHAPKDGDPELSYRDVLGAYHGVDIPAPMRGALERAHPEDVRGEEPSEALQRDRDDLLAWLDSGRVSDGYDDIDSEFPPADILDASCVTCHSSRAAEDVRAEPFLENWDLVRLAIEDQSLTPMPEKVLIITTHTHALTMAIMALVLGALLVATRFPRFVTGAICAAIGLALFADVGSWWLARDQEVWVRVIWIAGPIYGGGMALACGLVLLDLWFPLFGSKHD